MGNLVHDDGSMHEVWSYVQKDARALAVTEPFLARFVSRVILSAGSFQDALINRLSVALASAECPKEHYVEMLTSVLVRYPSVAFEAVQDLVAAHMRDPTCSSHLHAFLNFKGYHALQVHRVSHRLWQENKRELAFWPSNPASAVFGADIHPAACFGVGVLLDHGSGIVIGETAVVEDEVTILQNVTLGGTGKTLGDRHPKIRKGAMIGAGASVIGNVEVGSYSKVGAGSVVLQPVPAACTAVGVPARIVRRDPVHKPDVTLRSADTHS